MWERFPRLKIRWGIPAPRRNRMYLNTLTQQTQNAVTHAFQVTERSAATLEGIVRQAENQGAGHLAGQATTAINNAKVAIQAVKQVLESPHGSVAAGSGTGLPGANVEAVRRAATELLRSLG